MGRQTHSVLDLSSMLSTSDVEERIRRLSEVSTVVVPQFELEIVFSQDQNIAQTISELLSQLSSSSLVIPTDPGEDRYEAMAGIIRTLISRGHVPKLISDDEEFATTVEWLSGEGEVCKQDKADPHSATALERSSPAATNITPDANTNRGTPTKQKRTWSPSLLIGSGKRPELLRILIDTSMLMSKDMLKFSEQVLIPWATEVLNEKGVAIIAVPEEVTRELTTMAEMPSPNDNRGRQQKAINGVTILHRLRSANLLTSYSLAHAGRKQAADDVFISTMLQLLLSYDILFMVEDKKLAQVCNDIYKARNASEAHTGRRNRFAPCRLRGTRLELHFEKTWIGQDAYLKPNDEQKGQKSRSETKKSPKTKPKSDKASKKKSTPKFSRPKSNSDKSNAGSGKSVSAKSDRSAPTLRKLSDEKVKAVPYPEHEGDVVLGEQGERYILSHSGMSGGEGTVYPLQGLNDVVAKIYHVDQLTKWRMDKLALMVENPVNNRGVAWPSRLLSNTAGDPVGFLMPKVTAGIPIVDSVFNLSTVVGHFPNWNRKDLVTLAKNLSNVVNILHNRNEVIGDLNPSNILVDVDQGEPRVKLVDADSWQFAGYPSPVGMAEYTHPELRGQNFSEVLRTQKHDRYALTIIVFQILFLGKHPFGARGDLSLADAMKEFAFPYPLGTGEDRDKVPKGFAFKVWTHLPYPVQKSFHDVFASGLELPADHWTSVLKGYIDDISSDRLDALGNADRINPTAVRVPVGRADDVSEKFTCQVHGCGNVETFFGADYIARKKKIRFFRCRACMERESLEYREGESRICSRCSSIFSHPIWFEKMLDQMKQNIPNLCPNHGGLRSEFSCADCGSSFVERRYNRWQQQSRSQHTYCKQHTPRHQGLGNKTHADSGKKFRCARCTKSFSVRGDMAEMLASKRADSVVCFDCLNSPVPATTRVKNTKPPKPKKKQKTKPKTKAKQKTNNNKKKSSPWSKPHRKSSQNKNKIKIKAKESFWVRLLKALIGK